jgi:PAS domain S-box-containing protein
MPGRRSPAPPRAPARRDESGARLQRAEASLRANELQLQQILDNTTAALVFAKDLDGRYLFVNRAFERLAGRPKSEIVGRLTEEVFAPEIAAGLRANDREVLAAGRALEFEEPAGFGAEVRTLVSSKFPLFGADGRPYAVCGIAADITERKRTGDALGRAALAVSGASGAQAFETLVLQLAEILGVSAAMITVFVDAAHERMRSIAACLDGRAMKSFEYELASSPCAGVVGREFRYVASGVRPELRPGSLFEQLGFDSYAAYSLTDAAGAQRGLIAVMDRRPLANRELTEAMLKIFAVRASAELDRARAEEALRASEASYRSIFEASEDPIFVHDWDTGRIVDVSPAAATLYGYSREELLRLRVGEVSSNVPPYTEEEAARRIQQAKVRAAPVRFEWHARHRDGRLMWHEVTLKRATIAGEPRILAFTRDITASKRAQEAVRASEEQYRAIFNASADALTLRDADFRVVDVNPALLAMTGLTREEAIGSTRLLFTPLEHQEATREMFARELAGEATQYEMEAVRKDGTRFAVEVRGVPLQYRGQPHVFVIARDITARKRAEEAVRTSEEQYRAIFNASADALVLWNSDIKRVDVNPAYERMYGFTREEVLGEGYPGHLPEEYVARRHELVRRTLAGEPCQEEMEAVRKDGRRFRMEVRTIPIRHRGEPHVLAIVRDVTERKRAEEALRASEERYRLLFEMESDAIVLVDAETLQLIDANRAAEQLWGFDRRELLARRVTDLSVEPERTRVSIQSPEGRVHIPLRLHRKRDGTVFPVEITANRLTLDGRRIVVAAVRDITERRRAEEALRASEEQYRSIFNASADALVLRDADFRIVDVNATYEAMSGLRREEVLGADRIVANPREVEGPIRALHARALAGETIRFETQFLRRDGAPCDVELRGVPILHRGAPHVLYLGRDITAQKQADADRRELEAQLRQAQKMEAIGHLTGGIAHDFNNILTSIMGYVALAGDREAAQADPKLASHLERALASCERARDLIQQMLTFSRGRRGDPRPVALAPLVREAVKLLRSTLPSSVELATDVPREVPQVMLDPVHADQILLNLCINARDAMDGRGAIRVRLAAADGGGAVCASCRRRVAGAFVELAVSDTGPGIAPEVAERIFEPFFTTKEVGKGSGMGLATVHGIVHEHGGHVVVESVPGRGTTFRVLFPALASSGRGAGPADAGARGGTTRPRLAGRVLVVDDEESVGEFMRELLESWGLEATFVPTPAEALDAFGRSPEDFDLVITDQTMPQMTGIQLARELCAVRAEVPVVLYTGFADAGAEEKARAAGIVAQLRKPVDPAALLAALRAHLPAAPGG